MLILYNLNKTKIAGLKNYKDLRIERELSGDEVLFFSYPQIDNKHDYIKEETYLRTKKNEYVIKEVNVKDDWTEFVGKVNVEDLKGKAVNSFETIEQSCTNAVSLAIAGTGWAIGSCDVTKKRTVRKSNCSSYDILQEIKKVYLCDFKFDAINKKVYIYQSMGADKGSYFSDKLNLKKLEIQSNSYDFCTRIIPIGKDGLKINNINSGKEYVENYQYSNKVITVFWEDNRYTVVENLKEDATAKLNELSKPIRAYSAEIFDLANLNDRYKNILDYDLGDTITLLSKDKKVKEKQRIVKIIEYPEEPERNSCEIANRTLSFEDIQADTLEAVDTVNSVTTSDGMIDNSKVDFNPLRLEVVSLVAQKADIGELNAAVARIGTLEATRATITDLTSAVARIGVLEVGSATVTQLNAANAKIATLETRAASIDTLLAGNLTADNMKANLITAGTTLIADGSIASAKIISLSADKINAGKINTNLVSIQSSSGNMLISDNTIQIKDSTRIRVQIGKDASNDYNMYVWDSSGNLMFDATGLKASGIKSKIIRDDMVSDTANINATKIEKESLVTRINGATTLLLASKVKLDTENQTLEVAFNSLKSTVTTTANTVSSQGTSISTIQGQITSKIWQQDITTAITDVSSMTKINGVELLNQTYVSNTAAKPFTYGIYTVVPASELGLTDNKNLIKCTNSQMLRSDFIPFVPGKPYYVTLSAYNLETTNGILYVGIEYYDKNKVSLGSNDFTIYAFQKSTTDLPANSWKSFEGYVNTDSSRNIAGYIRLRILTRWSSLTGVTYLKDISVRQLGAYINSDIETRMTSTETSITQINNSIALKVSTSDFTTYQNTVNSNVTALSTRVSTAEGSISLLQNQISLKVEQSDIITEINNISIGARNLLRNSTFNDGKKYWNSMGGSGGYWTILPPEADKPESSIAQVQYTGFSQNVPVYTYAPGTLVKSDGTEKVTISFDIFAIDKNLISETVLTLRLFPTADSLAYVTVVASFNRGQITNYINGTWARYSYTYSIPSSTAKYLKVGLYQSAGSVNFKIREIKVELGTKATDWTPAPEDQTAYTDTQISTAKAEIKLTTDSIISTVSSVQSSVTSLGTRVTSAESSIVQLSSSIALKVNVGDFGTLITQNASNVKIAVGQIGGKNLLKNGGFRYGLMGWVASRWRGPTDWTYTVWETNTDWTLRDADCQNPVNYGSTLAVRVVESVAGTLLGNGVRQYVRVLPNKTYTISALMGAHRANVGWDIYATDKDFKRLTSITSETVPYTGYPGGPTEETWYKVNRTFTTPSNCEGLDIYFYATEKKSTGTDCYMFLDRVQLEEGPNATAFSANPNELRSATVTISDSGLEVLNGGISIKNKSGAEVLSGDTAGNLTMTGEMRSQSGDMWVGLNAGGLTFQDWNRKEQMLRIAIASYASNRDMNGVEFAMPRYSDFIRFSHISRDDLNNGWSDSDTFYNFFELWSGNNRIGNADKKKGMTINAPLYINDGIKLYSGSSYTSDIYGAISWNSRSSLLGLYGDNGTAIGYKSGDELKARLLVTEETHPGTDDNIISWGNYNFNGYTFHNANINARSLSVSGSKNCLQKTVNYGERLINAYETAEYFFGDLGFGKINSDGECFVYIDDIFLECINTDAQYHVFTQCYHGAISKIQRHKTYFIVNGEPGTEFSCELKAKRKGYENNRLDTQDIETQGESNSELFTDKDFKVETSEEALMRLITFQLENFLMEE